MYLLAIETSCDECSVSVVTKGEKFVKPLSNTIFTQIDLHQKFGGIVPEVASRSHLEMLPHVLNESLESAQLQFKDITAVAVTQGPGLMGALLVGVSTAKALAFALDIPLIGVHHLEGHLHSLFLEPHKPIEEKHLPLLVCLVSGGHTNLYLISELPPKNLSIRRLSESRDDAAGEAFDKCAKLLGLTYPGGVKIDELSKKGDRKHFNFPRPLMDGSLDFSFSGLKTAVNLEIKRQGFEPHVWGERLEDKLPQGQILWDFCSSVQEAIVDTLIRKIELALNQTGAQSLAIVGGVSANSRFRVQINSKFHSKEIFIPKIEFCTDNAAMIGACGFFKYQRGEFLTKSALLEMNAYSTNTL